MNNVNKIKIKKESISLGVGGRDMAYPIFVRDAAQQRYFLEGVQGKSIDLDFCEELCVLFKYKVLGMFFTEQRPDRMVVMTCRDILTRHGIKVRRILLQGNPLYYGFSKMLGWVSYGVAVFFFCASFAVSQMNKSEHSLSTEMEVAPGVPMQLLYRITGLPGAIDEVLVHPKNGFVRVYVPVAAREAFEAAIDGLSEMPFLWEHEVKLQGDKFVWTGEWISK